MGLRSRHVWVLNALTHGHQLSRLVCPLTCEHLLENIIIYGFLNDIA